MDFRSAPMKILSLACSKSSMSTSRYYACCKQCRLVHQIGEIRTRHARRATRQNIGTHIGRTGTSAYAPAKSARGHGCRAVPPPPDGQNVRAATKRGRARQDGWSRQSQSHRSRLQSVHFNQQLIQGLFTFVVAAAQTRAALGDPPHQSRR